MPKPVLQALIIADHVYQDKETGKKIICGTFNTVWFTRKKETPPESAEKLLEGAETPATERKLPWRDVQEAGSPTAFISMTEVRGPITLELRFVDLSDNTVLLRSRFPIKCESPLATVEAVVPVPRLLVPRAGTFALELLSDDEPLGALRITALERPE